MQNPKEHVVKQLGVSRKYVFRGKVVGREGREKEKGSLMFKALMMTVETVYL